MKYLCIIICAIFSYSYMLAQPIITNKTIPTIGEQYSYTLCDTTGIKAGSDGSNVVWDYSNLIKLQGANNTVNFEIVSPNSTPYFNQFPASNYAYKQVAEN